MDIYQIILKFIRVPPIRKYDVVTKGISKIMICSENVESVDIGTIHAAYQKNGYNGFPYHYVVKKGTNYDGKVYYCRPKIYQNELVTNNEVVSNSIAILIAGTHGSTMSDNQRDSLIKLVSLICEQECMSRNDVCFRSQLDSSSVELTSTPPNDISTIMNQIYSGITSNNQFKGIVQHVTQNGVKTVSGSYDAMVSTSTITSTDTIASITGVPKSSIDSMNPHITNKSNVPPNTVVFIPKANYSLSLVSLQQAGVASAVVSKIKENVKYAIDESKAKIAGNPAYNYDPIPQTNLYGGKPALTWKSGITLPGYHNSLIIITDKETGKEADRFTFLVSPSSVTDSRSNNIQTHKTSGGWLAMRGGKSPGSLNLSGHILDTRDHMERHDFIEKYKKYVEDYKNASFEYSNKYSISAWIEGRRYDGVIQNITFSKSANQMFLYNYSISILVLNEIKVYNQSMAVRSIFDVLPASSNLSNTVGVDSDTSPSAIITENMAVKIAGQNLFSRIKSAFGIVTVK